MLALVTKKKQKDAIQNLVMVSFMIYQIKLSLYIRSGVKEFQVVMITGNVTFDLSRSVFQRIPGQ